jgi:hypothetical protein
MTVRSIPSHAAFPLAFARGAAEGKEIRFTVMRATLFVSKNVPVSHVFKI